MGLQKSCPLPLLQIGTKIFQTMALLFCLIAYQLIILIQSIDTKPIGGLTYEGYAWIDAKGNVGKSRLDLDVRAIPQLEPEEQQALQEIKDLYVSPILGFDNDHIEPIELKGLEGARYLVKQLKQLEMDLNNPLDKQE